MAVEAPRTGLRQRTVVQPSESSGEYYLAPRRLKDAVDIAIPVAQTPEDTNDALREEAIEAYTQALRDNPELGQRPPTLRARVKFMQDRLGYPSERIARLLGITANQIVRKDLRARRKEEVGKFEERVNNAVTVASVLTNRFHGYPDALVDRRISLHRQNGRLSDFTVFKAMEAGFGNIAVAIALDAARVAEQTTEGINGELAEI